MIKTNDLNKDMLLESIANLLMQYEEEMDKTVDCTIIFEDDPEDEYCYNPHKEELFYIKREED